MIDEKKLMFERPENRNPNQKGFEEFNIGWNKCNEKWIEIINEQPRCICTRREWYQKGYQDGLNADKWIPCEERLPDKEGQYLVTTVGFMHNVVGTAYFDSEMWHMISKVLAWQPLPQPYKKEGAE